MNFGRRQFTKLALSSAAAYPLTRARSARAEANLLDRFIPPELKPFIGFAKNAIGAYNGISEGAAVAAKLAEFLGILPAQPTIGDMLASLQNQIALSAAETLWTMKSLDRQNRLGVALGKTETALQQRLWGMPVGDSTLSDSNTTVKQAMQPIQFERVFHARVTGDWGNLNYPSRWQWKDLFNDAGVPVEPEDMRTENVNGTDLPIVYDWRLGVPQLVQLIALRVQVIAAADPDFRSRRSVFADELLGHKAALETHARRMDAGVRSASLVQYNQLSDAPSDLWVGAADLHTGASLVRWYDLTKYPVSINLPPVRETLEADCRQIVLSAMPVRDMEEMASTLGALANP